MRPYSIISTLLLFISCAVATDDQQVATLPVGTYYPPSANCFEYQIPVTITSNNVVFNITKWEDDYALQDFLTSITTRPSAGYPGFIADEREETESFLIAASFCTPRNSEARKKAVVIATHGIGQVRSHWNSQWEPEKYNFVQHSINTSYSVFFYDRLGCGDSQKCVVIKILSASSSHPEHWGKKRWHYNTQGFWLHQSIPKATANPPTTRDSCPSGQLYRQLADKVVAMGFSFGSYITHYTVAAYPELFDGAILTAINYNASGLNQNGLYRSFVPRVAAL